MAGELYADGYIATSQIGDFALLHRLKGAVNNLVMGKAASQGLDQWLFDINKARTPQEIKKISTWQNSDINEKQKEAVEKILSVPDVCLIQGPPGTGKTTVIAEAIYQLVIRNKRVLVASQANLAVDNALERLISNPKIRAIRLGSAKKIDSSVSNITEGNVFVVSGILNAFKNLLTYRDELMFGKDTFLCLIITRKWRKSSSLLIGNSRLLLCLLFINVICILLIISGCPFCIVLCPISALMNNCPPLLLPSRKTNLNLMTCRDTFLS